MKFKLTEELWKEGNMYVSYCPELDIASCGETVDQAKKNLKEVILINLEEHSRTNQNGSSGGGLRGRNKVGHYQTRRRTSETPGCLISAQHGMEA
jgi:predicted RNase H-like HicB family nuclease